MVADSHHREKTFRIEKKSLESRKIFQSQKKKKRLNREKCLRIEKYFVTRVEKKS